MWKNLKSWSLFWDFAKRRFLDLRYGHSMVGIVLSFINFALLAYNFAILRVPILSAIFTHLWLFAAVFVLIYTPIALIVGYWYRTTQLPVENIMSFEQHPLWAKTMRLLLDVADGKAGREEVEQVRQMLIEIEKRLSHVAQGRPSER